MRTLAGGWWGCTLAIALAALLSSGASAAPCADDDFAGNLGCNSSDVTLTALSATSIFDGCDYIGDTATAALHAQLSTTAPQRYDIGIYLATDAGGPLTGMCHHDYLPVPPFPTWESAGDVCGDIASAAPVERDLAGGSPITVPCIDVDGDGSVDLRGLLSWANNASNGTTVPHCTGLADAVPLSPTRCTPPTLHNIVNLPVPTQTIEIQKELIDADPADVFELQIDDTTYAVVTSTGESTGPVPVTGGTSHVVEEIAGDPETNLADYDSSIECFELVGTCTNNPAVRCITDAMCDGGACDLAPLLVASCSDCMSQPVTVPNAPSTIQCTITNTPEPSRLVMFGAGAVSLWGLTRRRRVFPEL